MYLDASSYGAAEKIGTLDSDLVGNDIYIDDIKINSSRWWIRGDVYVSGHGYEEFSIYYYGKNMDSSDLSRVTVNSVSAFSDDLGSYYISGVSFTAQDTLDKTSYELQLQLLAGNDIIYGTKFDDSIITYGGDDFIFPGAGDDNIVGGIGSDTLRIAGSYKNAEITRANTSHPSYFLDGDEGLDILSGIEWIQFDDKTVSPHSRVGKKYLPSIRDYDGNLHGGASSSVEADYFYQGQADVNDDGRDESVYTNDVSGRWVTVGSDLDFSDFGAGGNTRVVGLYDDPLVVSGHVEKGSAHDSQVRFQSDLYNDNLRLGSAADVDNDGLGEVFWKTTDGSAYLRSIHHLDGNVKYANYMNAGQMTDYLSQHGHLGSIGSSLGL